MCQDIVLHEQPRLEPWNHCMIGVHDILEPAAPPADREKKEPVSNTIYFVTKKNPSGFG